MEVSFKLEGLDRIDRANQAVRESIAAEINKGVYASAQKVVTEAKRSILDGDKSGRVYKRRSVTHKASAPGEAPASDTGRLVNSTHAEAAGAGEALAISGNSSVNYAAMLEFGTSRIAPRPFMFPALEKSRAWILERLNKAVRTGVINATKS